MKTFIKLFPFCFVLLLGLFTNATATQCPSTNVVTNPVMFQWTHHPVSANNPEEYYSGTLEMGEVTLNVAGETLTTRAYRQEGGTYSIPGPTIAMQPGNKYVMRFKNTLPYQPLSPDHNTFKDPNVTNVHTHGVHISGESPADDVTRFFEGGFGGDYVYEIPADHMGGTFWYHAHHHGSTFLQVSSGAFGLMLIDDSLDNIPVNVANMMEKHLAFGFLEPGNASGTGGDSLISGTFSAGWTVNGTVSGNICLPPDTWQHWRILVADQDARLVDLEFGSECEIARMGHDGVWRNEVPLVDNDNVLEVTGASRVDLAVRCSADSDIMLGNDTVAQIYVDGVSDASVHPYAADGISTWFSQRPSYLRDLRFSSVDNFESIRMGARSVLGSKFDADVPNLVLNADGIQEWGINGATNHPFHLHVYHVQMVDDCGPYEAGEYYDVVAGNCDVRFDLNQATSTVYDGRTILHCHILAHEDQGAMGWLDVIGGISPPTYPIDNDIGTMYAEYYSLGGTGNNPPAAPSGLTANGVSSSQINLNWMDSASDEDGFDIERSLDGVSFSLLTSVAANVTSYSDTGLMPATMYTYRVSAYNANGSSAWSNTATATTDPVNPGASLDVGAISVSGNSQGRGFKTGVAEVEVIDDQGNPVADAVVSGEFSGDINELIFGSTPTDAGGLTTLETTQSTKGLKNLTFCVTSITHDTLQDFTAVPGTVCGSL